MAQPAHQNTVSKPVDKAIQNLGFESLNPMQTDMLANCKKSGQLLLFSPTGSGKTVAFLLPLLEKIDWNQSGIQAIVLTPSRELALQIEQVFKSMGTGLKAITCYGGHPVRVELNSMKELPSLLIGTPGRINYHFQRGNLKAQHLPVLVIDEYDKVLELGFEREMAAIFSHIGQPGQLILTSATRSVLLPDFVKITDPVVLDYTDGSTAPPETAVRLIRAAGNDKLELLGKLLDSINEGLTLVFCNHREAVERISTLLLEKGFLHETYHGGYEQSRRERALIKFRNGSVPVLVATDLASRGLDIAGVENIIHYQAASGETAFIHRNGRTARMGKEGTVWMLLTANEKLPEYLNGQAEETNLPVPDQPRKRPYFATLYFGAGKKDKISKTDIVGLLIQKGGLKKEEIGMINILDYESFAAVPSAKISQLCALLLGEKIKGKKIKIALSD